VRRSTKRRRRRPQRRPRRASRIDSGRTRPTTTLADENVHRTDEARHPLVGGTSVDVFGSPDLPHPSAVHDGDAIRHAQRFVLIVGNVEKRHSESRLDATQFDLESLAKLQIEGAQGFVEQKGLRTGHDRPRERDALLFTP
jgi:hypothetical protein